MKTGAGERECVCPSRICERERKNEREREGEKARETGREGLGWVGGSVLAVYSVARVY